MTAIRSVVAFVATPPTPDLEVPPPKLGLMDPESLLHTGGVDLAEADASNSRSQSRSIEHATDR
jgi:hypothetical protein